MEKMPLSNDKRSLLEPKCLKEPTLTKEAVINYMKRNNEEEIKVVQTIKASMLDPKDEIKLL